MRRQSNPITPHETCWTVLIQIQIELCIFFGLYFDFVLSPVFKYKALVGVLSSSTEYFNKVGFSWQPLSENWHYRLVSFWARSLQSFYFLCFLSCECKPRNEPETSGNWTHKYPKTALLFITRFFIEHSCIYFSFLLSELFSVICLFWHTFTARDDTRTRQHTRQESK